MEVRRRGGGGVQEGARSISGARYPSLTYLPPSFTFSPIYLPAHLVRNGTVQKRRAALVIPITPLFWNQNLREVRTTAHQLHRLSFLAERPWLQGYTMASTASRTSSMPVHAAPTKNPRPRSGSCEKGADEKTVSANTVSAKTVSAHRNKTKWSPRPTRPRGRSC